MLEHVHWLGHDCFKIKGEKIIYTDPYQIKGGETADIILITHDHYDHLSMDDIEKITGEKTVIVLPHMAAGVVQGNIKRISPGDSLTIDDIEIQAVPAYNIGKKFHPKDQNHVGYVFKVDGITYYLAGDTDHIPEMKDLTVDVAFLPVGSKFTMNAEEAAKAAEDIQPKIAVPMHWGSIIGSRKDAETFKRLCSCEVVILEKEN